MPPDTLHLALAQAKVSHANIKGIDTSEAEAMPGVYRVLTHKDVKGKNRITGLITFPTNKGDGWDRPILNDTKIFQYGDALAIVCADSEAHARAAADKVKFDLELLPEYLNAPDAMAPDAIEIHPGTPNTYFEQKEVKGQETAPFFADANNVVAEGSYYTQRQPHLPIEPDVGYGYMNEEGKLVIHSKSIGLHLHGLMIAPGLGLDFGNDMVMVQCNAGGTFGYKFSPTMEALIGVAVLATGRPCHLRYNYEQQQQYTGKRSPFFTTVRYAADMAQGNMPEVGVLMVYEANPVYALPGKDIEAVFKKSDFSVAFTCFFDETARRCDLVLPNALGLERYDDVAEPFSYGKFVYALVRPVAEPLYQARPAGDVVIDMAYKLGINLGVSDVVTMLKAKAFNIGADWGSLSDGNVYVSDIVVPNKTLAYRFSPDDLALVEKAEAAAASSGKELAVAFVSKLGLGTPETAIPPFNTKLITDDELDKNMLVAAVNGATLKKLGLYEGNRIVLTSKAGKVMAKIRVFEGVTNDTVALTMGFGHTAFGEFNDGKGMDVMALVTPSSEPGSGLSVWNDTRVNVAQA